MKRVNRYVIGLVALASLGWVSTKLSAMSAYGQVSTSMESYTTPSSSIAAKNWSVRGWQEGPEIEIVQNRQRSVLKLRSFQSKVVIYRKVHVNLDRHPNVLWEQNVTE